jgi:FkbM family methyltransferase
MKKIIYDLGCHNGSNIPYYLLKADLVVVADANPKLCEIIKYKFQKEIQEKRLIVENCIITHEASGEKKLFYIFEQQDVLSTIYPETKLYFKNKEIKKSDYVQIEIISKNILDLLYEFGDPFYIKIDLENYDHIILREIFNNRINPKYISSECHNLEVFNLMTNNDKYNFFKLSKGKDVHLEKYQIKNVSGLEINYEFPVHSAGPFGEDIKGNWLSKDIFKLQFFLNGGSSWVDIHALRSD